MNFQQSENPKICKTYNYYLLKIKDLKFSLIINGDGVHIYISIGVTFLKLNNFFLKKYVQICITLKC